MRNGNYTGNKYARWPIKFSWDKFVYRTYRKLTAGSLRLGNKTKLKKEPSGSVDMVTL